MKIGVIGAESSGKSTLCRQLSEQCGYLWIKEYARTYVEALNRPYNRGDLDAIAAHLSEQITADYGDKVMLFDTEMIIMKVWYEHVYADVPPLVEQTLRNAPMDCYLLLAPDLPAEPDPVRENLDRREYFHAWYERELQQTGVPYTIIRGTGDVRTQAAIQAIRQALSAHNAQHTTKQ